MESREKAKLRLARDSDPRKVEQVAQRSRSLIQRYVAGLFIMIAVVAALNTGGC